MTDYDHYIGEIRLFAHGVIPKGWRRCDGQLLNVAQYSVLFSLLGNRFGGDGRSNFGLPNLNGRAALAAGAGPGLTDRVLASSLGTEGVYVLPDHTPQHKHAMRAVEIRGTTLQAEGCSFARSVAGEGKGTEVAGYALTAKDNTVTLGLDSISYVGKYGKHANRQPYLTLQFCIALDGVFPPRVEE